MIQMQVTPYHWLGLLVALLVLLIVLAGGESPALIAIVIAAGAALGLVYALLSRR